MDEKLLKSLAGKKNELDRFRPFNKAVLRNLKERFVTEWTYNSNAIEGNTLTLSETDLVLNRGITIGNKSMREHFEAVNHKQCVERIERFVQKKEALTIDFILELHRIILHGIDDENAGRFRRQNVRILGVVHLPPDARKVPREMEELIAWYYSNYRKMPVPQLAADLHHRFVWIHPFIDGNGRTARLLMNLVLMKRGYPPAVILNLDRKRYYRTLRLADAEKLNDFENFVGRAIERSLIIYLESLKPAAKISMRQAYISLQEAAEYCPYSQEYLSLLARRGKLSSVKFGRNWMTTREAVDSYMESIRQEQK